MKRKSTMKTEVKDYYIVKKHHDEATEENEGSLEQQFMTRRSCKYYSPETKIEAVKFAKNNLPKDAAFKYKIPLRTIRRWIQEYKIGGKTAFYEFANDVPLKINKQIVDDGNIYEEGITTGNASIGNIREIKDESVLNSGHKNNISRNIEDRETEEAPISLTDKHLRLNPTHNKLPEVEGWEKVSLISPSLRLWAAQESLKQGCQKIAISIGVSDVTVQRWVAAYKTLGEEAHIFKINVKRYSGSVNNGRGRGVELFNDKDKKEIIDRVLREGRTKVALLLGISPNTITHWRKKLNYPPKEVEYEVEEGVPVPAWYSNGRSRASHLMESVPYL